MDDDSKTDRAAAAADADVSEKSATASGPDDKSDLERSTFALHFSLLEPEAGAPVEAPADADAAEPPPLAAAADGGAHEEDATGSDQDAESDSKRSAFQRRFTGLLGAVGKARTADASFAKSPPHAVTAETGPAVHALGHVEQNVFVALQHDTKILYGALANRVENVSALVAAAMGSDIDFTTIQQLHEFTTPVSPEKVTTYYELVNDLRRQEAVYAARVMQVAAIEAFLKARAAAAASKNK